MVSSVVELQADEDIEDWLDKLEDAVLAKHGDVSDARKLATLRSCIGASNVPIVKQLQKNLPEAERTNYNHVRAAIIEQFRR